MGRIHVESGNGNGHAAADFRVEVPSLIQLTEEGIRVNGNRLPISFSRFAEDNSVAFNSPTLIIRDVNTATGHERTVYSIYGPGVKCPTEGLVFTAIPDDAMQKVYVSSNSEAPVDDYFGDDASRREGPPPETAEPVKKKKPRWKKTTDSEDL